MLRRSLLRAVPFIVILGLAGWVLGQAVQIKTSDGAADQVRFAIKTGADPVDAYFDRARVGIGTTTPATTLHLGPGAPTLRIGDGTAADGGQIEWRTTGARHWNIDQFNTDLRFFTEDASDGAGVVRYSVTNAGDATLPGLLAVGTSTTPKKLNIDYPSGHVTIRSPGYSFLTGENNNHFCSNLYFDGANWNRYNTASGGGILWAGNDGRLGTYYTASGANPVGAFSNPIWILANGNVGLGTTSPQDRLDMAGNAVRFYSATDYQRIYAGTYGLNIFTNKLASSGLRLGELYGGLGMYSGDGATDYSLTMLSPAGKSVAFAANGANPMGGSGLFLTSGNNLGIGTTGPSGKLHVNGTLVADGNFYAGYDDTTTNGSEFVAYRGNGASPRKFWAYFDCYNAYTNSFRIIASNSTPSSIVVAYFTSGGDEHLNNDAVANAFDLAELYQTREPELAPADVVVVDPDRPRHVRRSARPFDPAVAGVISTDPAAVMGLGHLQGEIREQERTYAAMSPGEKTRYETAFMSKPQGVIWDRLKKNETRPLALAGRVPCRVSAENGPVRTGDLLTTSSKAGTAMKWTLRDAASAGSFEEFRSIAAENERRRSAVLGKALEALEGGEGVIEVLVTTR